MEEQNKTKVAEFKVGETYWVRATGDWDCIYKFKVLRRTAKTVWLNSCHGENQARRIDKFEDPRSDRVTESCAPLGRHAMSPLLLADRDGKSLPPDPWASPAAAERVAAKADTSMKWFMHKREQQKDFG